MSQRRYLSTRLTIGPLVGALLSIGAVAHAGGTMESKFIRIDPEPTIDKRGTPLIPMLIEIGNPVPINSFADGCDIGGSARKATQETLRCISSKIEKDGFEKQFEFPQDNATIVSIVDGQPFPLTVTDSVPFKDAQNANAGVAWLILMDASSSVGSRWPEMQETAESLIKLMGQSDAVMVRIMDDRGTREKTKWIPAAAKQSAIATIRKVPTTFKTGTQVDSLIARIETESIGSFQDLLNNGVDGVDDAVPIVQAIVILSDGGDTSTDQFAGGTKAEVLHEKLVKGEIGINDLRLPIPVVSLYFPKNSFAGLVEETRRGNEFAWMKNISTPEVGGYFDIIQEGEAGKGQKIAKLVRTRFDNMNYVEAKASCLDPSGSQTFKLAFENTKTKILPATFDKVGIAYDFSKWLLVVDKKMTEDAAVRKALQPGETFDIYGDFCWGEKTGAAEAFFITETDVADVKKAAADKTGKAAKLLLQTLSGKGQKAETLSTSNQVAKFRVPATAALFDNKPDNFNLNVVVFDNKALRVSARDQNGLLQLRAAKAPINKLLIVGAIGGGVVLILLIAILARGGGGGGGGRQKRRKGGAPPTPGPIPGQPPGPSFANAGPPVTFSPPPAPRPEAGMNAPSFPFGSGASFALGPTAYAPAPAAGLPPTVGVPYPQATPAVAAPYRPEALAPTYAQPDLQQPSVRQAIQTPAPPSREVQAVPGGVGAGTSFPTTCPNPACRHSVMVPPRGTAQCAFCGTLVNAAGQAIAPISPTSDFALTGHVQEQAAARAVADLQARVPAQPTPGTIALQVAAPGHQVRAVTLTGPGGNFRIIPNVESRVGRDGTLCSVMLDEPRVSGVHATLKLEGGMLLVRDDSSHNGTFVNGNRIAAGTWTPVPGGSQVRFGPAEFSVRHEGSGSA